MRPSHPRSFVSTAAALAIAASGALYGCAQREPRPAVALVAASAPPALTCVDHWPEARYRNFGYDHIVHLASRCRESAVCQVSTDVNPEAQSATVKPQEHVEVLTFRGSPASTFSASVSCKAAPQR